MSPPLASQPQEAPLAWSRDCLDEVPSLPQFMVTHSLAHTGDSPGVQGARPWVMGKGRPSPCH